MTVAVLTKKVGGSGADRQMIRMVAALLKAGEGAKLYVRKEGGAFWPAASKLPLRPVPSFGALAGALERDRPDLVYTHTIGLAQEASRAKSYLAQPFRHVHGIRTHLSLEWKHHPLAATWRRLRLSRLVPRVDRFHAVSQAVADDFRRCFPAHAHRTFVLHNFIEPEPIRAQAKAPLPAAFPAPFFFTCGRFTPAKDYQTLLKAFASVTRRDGDLRLLIAGTGSQKERLKHLTRRLKIEARVAFLGFQPNPFRWMARAQALLLSSRWEGSPNVVLEAFACGTPVIATAFPGAGELIRDGVNGRLVPVADADALAQAMTALLRKERDRLAEGARATADNFTPERWVPAFSLAATR